MRHENATGKRIQQRFRQARVACAVRQAAAGMAIGMSMSIVPAAVHAQTSPPAHRFDIPAGSLEDALNRFGREAGLLLSYPTDLTAGRQSAGLHGSYTPADGLQRLLTGSGLRPVVQSNGGYLLEKSSGSAQPGASANELPAVEVVAGRDRHAEALNPETTVGSKLPLSQREIPQTVQVVTAQQIEQQKLVDLNDAVKQVPGMTAAPYNAGQTDFYARGFPVDVIQLDGIPFNVNLSANGLTNLDLAMYDHVEVLDGPAGLLSGFGGAGGALNLVRKRAQRQFAITGDVSAGTGSDRRQSLDVTGPLNQAGTVRGRFVESVQDTHLPQDGTFKKQGLVYGEIEADLTPTTLVTLGGSYQRLFEKAMDNGYPAWSNTQLLIDPSRYIGSPDDRLSYTTTTAFGTIEQKLGAGWKAKFTAQVFNTSSHIASSYPFGTGIDVDTGNTTVTSFLNRESNAQHTFDLFAAGPVSLFGRTHQLTAGMDYQSYHYGLHDNFNFGNYQTYNYFAPVLPSIIPGNVLQTSFVDMSQFNLYTNARISLADPLTLVVGGALSWWNVRNTYGAGENTFGAPPSAYHLSAKVTPFFGLIYDIDNTLSAYASYTSIFEPQTATDTTGNMINPLKGNQIELGIKGEYLAGKLNTSASIFQVTQENRAVPDPAAPLSGYDVATGKARSRGFQLSATGELLPGWTLFGGYTYTDVVSLDSTQTATGTSGQAFTAIAPKHVFRLWTNYRFRGELNKLNVGGGIDVSSRYFAQNASYTLAQGGYATVNLQAGYDITKNVSAQLNIDNLFNRRYFQSLGGVGNGNFLGDLRSVLFTLRFRM